MTKLRKLTALLLAGALTLLFLTACSGGGGSSGSKAQVEAEVMEAIDGDEPISDDTHVTGDADSLFDSSDNMPVAPNNEQ